MRNFLVYVENKAGAESPYFVSEGAVERALGQFAEQALILCRSENDPDLKNLAEADYFVGSGFNPERIRQHGRRLKIIHCTSAGVEKYMPLNWLPDGAVLTNSSGVHAEKGGAFGAMVVMMLCENIPRHISNQRKHVWDNRLSGTLSRKTVVIVGFGALGSAIAGRLKHFGANVIGVSRNGSPSQHADRVVSTSDLASVLPQADCLVVSCPLTSETAGLIGKSEIALMKQGASLFNIARGPVVDNVALIEALQTSRLSGAALDVFDKEPLSRDSDLWDVPNLMIFPHISCDDEHGYVDRCLSIFAENVSRHRAGRDLVNVVDPETGY